MHRLRRIPIALLALGIGFPPAAGADRGGEGPGLIGFPAPPLQLEDWFPSPRLEIPDLTGRVVLVRWWTDTCPFCSSTAPVLNELDRTYRDRGLQVIGVFHPKPPGDADPERVRRAIARFGFEFPVALDADWTALRRWWLDRRPRGWTSVSFLLDRTGTIRYVHPGGEFHPGAGGDHLEDHRSCQREYREIVALIEELLADDR